MKNRIKMLMSAAMLTVLSSAAGCVSLGDEIAIDDQTVTVESCEAVGNTVILATDSDRDVLIDRSSSGHDDVYLGTGACLEEAADGSCALEDWERVEGCQVSDFARVTNADGEREVEMVFDCTDSSPTVVGELFAVPCG